MEVTKTYKSKVNNGEIRGYFPFQGQWFFVT